MLITALICTIADLMLVIDAEFVKVKRSAQNFRNVSMHNRLKALFHNKLGCGHTVLTVRLQVNTLRVRLQHRG